MDILLQTKCMFSNYLIPGLAWDLNGLTFTEQQTVSPGVDFSQVEIVDVTVRPRFLLQICAKKLGIGERGKWIELSLWTSPSKKRTRNRPRVITWTILFASLGVLYLKQSSLLKIFF